MQSGQALRALADTLVSDDDGVRLVLGPKQSKAPEPAVFADLDEAGLGEGWTVGRALPKTVLGQSHRIKLSERRRAELTGLAAEAAKSSSWRRDELVSRLCELGESHGSDRVAAFLRHPATQEKLYRADQVEMVLELFEATVPSVELRAARRYGREMKDRTKAVVSVENDAGKPPLARLAVERVTNHAVVRFLQRQMGIATDATYERAQMMAESGEWTDVERTALRNEILDGLDEGAVKKLQSAKRALCALIDEVSGSQAMRRPEGYRHLCIRDTAADKAGRVRTSISVRVDMGGRAMVAVVAPQVAKRVGTERVAACEVLTVYFAGEENGFDADKLVRTRSSRKQARRENPMSSLTRSDWGADPKETVGDVATDRLIVEALGL